MGYILALLERLTFLCERGMEFWCEGAERRVLIGEWANHTSVSCTQRAFSFSQVSWLAELWSCARNSNSVAQQCLNIQSTQTQWSFKSYQNDALLNWILFRSLNDNFLRLSHSAPLSSANENSLRLYLYFEMSTFHLLSGCFSSISFSGTG